MIRVQKKDFDIGEEIKALGKGRDDMGAIVSFTGTVRGTIMTDKGEQAISSMLLEHYPGMTQKELERIESEARKRWDLLECLVIHRYGELAPGDNIVLVITSSAHRKDAFLAAQFLMDYLKSSAPFWKKEKVAGEEKWVSARDSDTKALDDWLS